MDELSVKDPAKVIPPKAKATTKVNKTVNNLTIIQPSKINKG